MVYLDADFPKSTGKQTSGNNTGAFADYAEKKEKKCSGIRSLPRRLLKPHTMFIMSWDMDS
jgi:hypothetical protein